MSTYPVFLTGLDRRRAVVFGDGTAAARKVVELAQAGFGRVDAYSPAPSAELEDAARHPAVALHRRGLRPGDLAGATLAVATDQDRALNARLFREAEAVGTLLLATDDVPHCHVFAGATIRRGRLSIAIGTSGAAPALAVRIKEDIERRLPDEIPELLELAAQLRPEIAARITGFAQRRAAWYAIVDDLLLRRHLARGRTRAARSRALAIVAQYAEEPSAPATAEPARADAPELVAVGADVSVGPAAEGWR